MHDGSEGAVVSTAPGVNAPTIQAMLDAGLNGFGAQLLVESYAQARDATGVRRAKVPPPPPIHVLIDGVVLSLAPRLARGTERTPAAALWAAAYDALDALAREHGITTVLAHTDAVTRARLPHAEVCAQLVADVGRQLAALDVSGAGPLGYVPPAPGEPRG